LEVKSAINMVFYKAMSITALCAMSVFAHPTHSHGHDHTGGSINSAQNSVSQCVSDPESCENWSKAAPTIYLADQWKVAYEAGCFKDWLVKVNGEELGHELPFCVGNAGKKRYNVMLVHSWGNPGLFKGPTGNRWPNTWYNADCTCGGDSESIITEEAATTAAVTSTAETTTTTSVTRTSEVTVTVDVIVTVVDTPTFTSTPEVTSTHVATTTPVVMTTHVATTSPAVTTNPAVTTTPIVSSTPAVTTKSGVSSTPAVTTKPVVSTTPVSTTPAVTTTTAVTSSSEGPTPSYTSEASVASTTAVDGTASPADLKNQNSGTGSSNTATIGAASGGAAAILAAGAAAAAYMKSRAASASAKAATQDDLMEAGEGNFNAAYEPDIAEQENPLYS